MTVTVIPTGIPFHICKAQFFSQFTLDQTLHENNTQCTSFSFLLVVHGEFQYGEHSPFAFLDPACMLCPLLLAIM
jgi:hypothetical protein